MRRSAAFELEGGGFLRVEYVNGHGVKPHEFKLIQAELVCLLRQLRASVADTSGGGIVIGQASVANGPAVRADG